MQPWKIRLRTYLTGTWHYRWTGMAVAWAICVIGWLGVALIPNQFQAVAMIYVDTDTMMAPLLRGLTVSTDPQQQVSVMLNTLLSRPNLEQVVHLTMPRASSLSSADLAKRVENLQDNITIKPLATKNLFQLAYTDRDPDRGLNVSQTLLSIFVDSNIGSKRHDLEGAQSFLDTKVNEYETLVRQAEQRRTAFKQANLDVLSNSISPDQARTQVEAAREQLAGAEARLSSLRGQLAGIPKIIYIDGPGPIILSSATGNTPASGRGGSLFQRLAEAKQNLIDLKSKYTDDYPDVKAVQREVSQLQKELAATPPRGSEGTGDQSIPNPVYVQTQSKLSDAMTEVALQQQRLHNAETSLDNAKKMSSKAIEITAQFANLDRDYDLVHKTYQDLLSRRESAKLSQSVNDEQSSINVRIVEPPKKAPFPVAPNRPLLNSMVIVAALLAGLATAIALSINAGRFFAKEQLMAEFDYPIIGVVGRLARADDALNARRAYTALAACAGLLLCGYIVVLVALDASFRLTLRSML
ncbi:MAG TPA: XrtA system polysaccharide chain length determinant [Rhizomicrobium sp.]|nr:XrtA system polysaccharide chain length determinant [Rhizomicrobium sp.]